MGLLWTRLGLNYLLKFFESHFMLVYTKKALVFAILYFLVLECLWPWITKSPIKETGIYRNPIRSASLSKSPINIIYFLKCSLGDEKTDFNKHHCNSIDVCRSNDNYDDSTVGRGKQMWRLSIICFISGLGKLYSFYFRVINDMSIKSTGSVRLEKT